MLLKSPKQLVTWPKRFLPWAIQSADISSSRRNALFASGTTVCCNWPRSLLSIAKATERYAEKAVEDQLNIASKDYVQNLAKWKKTSTANYQPSWAPFNKNVVSQWNSLRSNTRNYCIRWRNPAKRLWKFILPLIFHSLFLKSSLVLLRSSLWKHQNLKPLIRQPKQLVVLSCHFKLPPPPRNQICHSMNEKWHHRDQHSQRQQRACYIVEKKTICQKYRRHFKTTGDMQKLQSISQI